MFTDFINRILGAERRPSVSNRLENDAVSSVIVKKTATRQSLKSMRKILQLWNDTMTVSFLL